MKILKYISVYASPTRLLVGKGDEEILFVAKGDEEIQERHQRAERGARHTERSLGDLWGKIPVKL